MGGAGAIAASAHLCTERFAALIADGAAGRVEDARAHAEALLALVARAVRGAQPGGAQGAAPRARPDRHADVRMPLAGASAGAVRCAGSRPRASLAALPRSERASRYENRTFPFDRARACARSMKSSRLLAARNSRVTSRRRAFSERRSSRPCLASSPKSTVAAIS